MSHQFKLAYIDSTAGFITNVLSACLEPASAKVHSRAATLPRSTSTKLSAFSCLLSAPERMTIMTLCLMLRLPAESAQAAREIQLIFS